MTESAQPAPVNAATVRHFRYYDLVMAAFVAVLLLSNIIGASTVSMVGGLTFGAGILFFPISYVIGAVLTVCYGYAPARRVVWGGFGALLFRSEERRGGRRCVSTWRMRHSPET